MGWDQLRAGIELPFDPSITVPELHEVEMTIPTAAPVVDVERAAADAVVATLAEDVTPGMTVAVGAGSRGLTGRVALLLPEDVAGEAGAADAAAFAPPADLTLDDVAYLQYTSGSTRAPRGVVLTQLNLVYNIFQIIQAHAMDEMVPDATGVSWLPLFHDMGLLLGAAATAITGAPWTVWPILRASTSTKARILRPAAASARAHPLPMGPAPQTTMPSTADVLRRRAASLRSKKRSGA
jgi:acyl-CoA synthetase (AMP-forming)/AMP-acid ligase II